MTACRDWGRQRLWEAQGGDKDKDIDWGIVSGKACIKVMYFMMLNGVGRLSVSSQAVWWKWHLGFIVVPREVLSPKSFIVEAVLKLWEELPDFCCGFMFWGIACIHTLYEYKDTHTNASPTRWFMFSNSRFVYVFLSVCILKLSFIPTSTWLNLLSNHASWFILYSAVPVKNQMHVFPPQITKVYRQACSVFPPSTSSGLFFRETSIGLDFLSSLQIHFDLTLKENLRKNSELSSLYQKHSPLIKKCALPPLIYFSVFSVVLS